MNESLSVSQLIFDASFFVQLVMLLLLGASIFSWMIIVTKWREIRSAQQQYQGFEEEFWNSDDLSELFRSLRVQRDQLQGSAKIFEAGFAEYSRLLRGTNGGAPLLDGVRRSMRVAMQRDLDRLESQLPILATIASVSPYVGLLGTVWGIMNAFIGLGQAQHVTLALVAPPIAEALIATAMGLFAAIPALIAYNRYMGNIDKQGANLEVFADEFIGLLHRQVHARDDSV